MIDADSFFIDMMKAILGDALEPMTDEQAAMDAVADYRTEQQAARMGVAYE